MIHFCLFLKFFPQHRSLNQVHWTCQRWKAGRWWRPWWPPSKSKRNNTSSGTAAPKTSTSAPGSASSSKIGVGTRTPTKTFARQSNISIVWPKTCRISCWKAGTARVWWANGAIRVASTVRVVRVTVTWNGNMWSPTAWTRSPRRTGAPTAAPLMQVRAPVADQVVGVGFSGNCDVWLLCLPISFCTWGNLY